MQVILFLAALVFAIYWFTGGKYGTDKVFGPPESLPFSRYNEVDVNVYFYFPDGKEAYLGRVQGASACGANARDFAARQNLTTNREWSYVCCTVEGGSECYRKIR